MSAGPLSLRPWRDRLISQIPEFRSVGLAADLAAARGALRVTPQAFVVPVSDRAAQRPGPGNSTVSQNVIATVAVVMAISNQRGANEGGEAALDLEDFRAKVWAALYGWRAPGAAIATEFSEGSAISFEDGVVLWSDRWVSAFFARA